MTIHIAVRKRIQKEKKKQSTTITPNNEKEKLGEHVRKGRKMTLKRKMKKK